MSPIEGLNRANIARGRGLRKNGITGPGVTSEISKGINLQEFKVLVQPVQHLPSWGRLLRLEITSGIALDKKEATAEAQNLLKPDEPIKPDSYRPVKRKKDLVDVSRRLSTERVRRSGCRCADKENGPACRSRFCEKKKNEGKLNNNRAMANTLRNSSSQNPNRRNEIRGYAAKMRNSNTPKLAKA